MPSVSVERRNTAGARYGGRVVARVGTATVEDVGGVLTAAGLAIPYGSTARWCR